VSFDAQKIKENAEEMLLIISKLKPSSSKGTYFKSIAISSTMSKSIAVDKSSIAGL
jgi:large subunit ribosomal protein L1